MDAREVELWRVREPERPLRSGMEAEGIEELAESIRRHGLLNPITVRDRGGFYEVVAGHRRLLALRRLGWERVDVRVVEPGDGEDVILGAHENLVRRDMSVVEEGRLVAALVAREGWGISQTARSLNRGEGWVRDRLDVLRWPEELAGAVCDGRLALGAGKALMGIEDERERAALIGHAVRNGCSVEVARRWREDANLGVGVSGSPVNLVGVRAPEGLSGGKLPCFFCDERSSIGELIYVWGHRECVVSMEDALRGPGSERGAAGERREGAGGVFSGAGGGGGSGPDSGRAGPV